VKVRHGEGVANRTGPEGCTDDRDGASTFVFDLIEPERPKVDRAVLDFVQGHVFDLADFVIRTDGACRLNPEMARMVVERVQAFTASCLAVPKVQDSERPRRSCLPGPE
jgi:CRISPR/Cas system-associated endonuclease Cas1